MDALATRARQDCFGSELAHRVEHSIEFQAVFLRYLYASRRDVTIVPVLTSFAHEAMLSGRRPDDDPRVPAVPGGGRARRSRRAGAGWRSSRAPISPTWGRASATRSPSPRRSWHASSARIGRCSRRWRPGDAAAFFESVARDGDRRRICGFSPIYALLRILGGAAGEVKQYGQWPDPNGVVSFASVVLE